MNPSSPQPFAPRAADSTPRLVCRVVRYAHAVFETAGARHIAACPDCQEFSRVSGALDAALRREALRAVQGQRWPEMKTALQSAHAAESDELKRGILQAVRNASRSTRVESVRRHSWNGLGLAGAAAAAVAIGFVSFQRYEGNAESRQDAREGAALIVDAVQTASDRLVDSVIPTTVEYVANNPLQQEMNSIAADAQTALDFLALNFLPRNSARANQATRGETRTL